MATLYPYSYFTRLACMIDTSLEILSGLQTFPAPQKLITDFPNYLQTTQE